MHSPKSSLNIPLNIKIGKLEQLFCAYGNKGKDAMETFRRKLMTAQRSAIQKVN